MKQMYPQKNLWAFTGFTYEELLTPGSHPHCETTEDILSMVGCYVEELKDISLRFRGSSNQRLIDLNATRSGGEIVLLPDRRRS